MNGTLSFEKILIIRLSSIGDIVQCSAIPRHLRKRFNQSQIHWVVRSDNEDLLKHHPEINKLIVFDRKQGLRGWRGLSRQLARENYTHVYDAHNNVRSYIMSLYLRLRRPPGAARLNFIRRSKDRFRRFLLFWLKLNFFSPRYTAVESYVIPLKSWQITYDHQGGELHVAPSTQSKVKMILADFEKAEVAGTSPRWIAIAPATAWPKKIGPSIAGVNW